MYSSLIFIVVYNNCSAEDSDVVGYQPLRCGSDDMDGEWSTRNITEYCNCSEDSGLLEV
jgi:hypothetical protein